MDVPFCLCVRDDPFSDWLRFFTGGGVFFWRARHCAADCRVRVWFHDQVPYNAAHFLAGIPVSRKLFRGVTGSLTIGSEEFHASTDPS